MLILMDFEESPENHQNIQRGPSKGTSCKDIEKLSQEGAEIVKNKKKTEGPGPSDWARARARTRTCGSVFLSSYFSV